MATRPPIYNYGMDNAAPIGTYNPRGHSANALDVLEELPGAAGSLLGDTLTSTRDAILRADEERKRRIRPDIGGVVNLFGRALSQDVDAPRGETFEQRMARSNAEARAKRATIKEPPPSEAPPPKVDAPAAQNQPLLPGPNGSLAFDVGDEPVGQGAKPPIMVLRDDQGRIISAGNGPSMEGVGVRLGSDLDAVPDAPPPKMRAFDPTELDASRSVKEYQPVRGGGYMEVSQPAYMPQSYYDEQERRALLARQQAVAADPTGEQQKRREMEFEYGLRGQELDKRLEGEVRQAEARGRAEQTARGDVETQKRQAYDAEVNMILDTARESVRLGKRSQAEADALVEDLIARIDKKYGYERI